MTKLLTIIYLTIAGAIVLFLAGQLVFFNGVIHERKNAICITPIQYREVMQAKDENIKVYNELLDIANTKLEQSQKDINYWYRKASQPVEIINN